jgi:outer membrane lipoprotein-sorting protein
LSKKKKAVFKSVIGPMDNSGVGSRNRHSPGLAPASGKFDDAGAFSGDGKWRSQTKIDALGRSKPVPIGAENPVKWVASAGQDESLTGHLNHRTAVPLPIRNEDLRVESSSFPSEAFPWAFDQRPAPDIDPGVDAGSRDEGRTKQKHRARLPINLMRLRSASLAAALIVGLFVASAPAQTVPVPKPAPKTRDNMPMSAADRAPVAALVTTKPPEPVIPDPRRNVPANIFATFDANQKAQAAKVSNYLSSLSTLVGSFVQVGPDGSRSTGDFYIQKPGKVRFEYDPPSTIAMIADGSSLAVRDRKLATQDIYPLSQTPLRYLLSDRIDLMRDTNVVNVTVDDVFISVTIEEKSALIGTSRLMLMVGAKDNQLKQWTVTDPQGYDTTVAVYNLDSAKKPDPALFKIDFTAYQTGGAN